MSIDHTIGGFVTQGWYRQSWEVYSGHLVRLQTLVHGETIYNGL